jgi:hypothetical protein
MQDMNLKKLCVAVWLLCLLAVFFEVDLYEILPDGGSVLLTGATMRARYRESLRTAIVKP